MASFTTCPRLHLQRCQGVDFKMKVTQDSTIVGAFLASGRCLHVAQGRMRSAQIATGLRGCTCNS